MSVETNVLSFVTSIDRLFQINILPSTDSREIPYQYQFDVFSTRNDAGNRYMDILIHSIPFPYLSYMENPPIWKKIQTNCHRCPINYREELLARVINGEIWKRILWQNMAKTCSKGKESEERVAAVSSHPINAVNADHNAGLAYTNMANVSRRLWTESGPREGSGRGEGRGGGSGMQDTVKLPAESPIPVWVDGWNGLCPLRALGPPSNRVFVLSPCL